MYEIFVYFQGKIVILIRFIFLMECKKDEKSDFFVFLKKSAKSLLLFKRILIQVRLILYSIH